MSRPRRCGAVAVIVSLCLTAACAEDGSDRRPAAACSNPPAIEVPNNIPADFPWPEGVSVTQAELTKQFVTVKGFGDRSVEELFEITHAELDAKGFDIINTDYEGFEAELYFAKADSLAGIAALREGPCDGYVQVNVIYDPLDTEAGRKAVRQTRHLSGEGSSRDG